MQAFEQSRLRKTPFGDTPAPAEPRVSGDLFNHSQGAEYEIFSFKPALDGLGGPAATAQSPLQLR